jgi:hypothetical protein
VRTVDDCRSGRSTETGEQTLTCKSCRCGQAGAGADSWEMRAAGELEQRSGKRRWSSAAAAKSSASAFSFPLPHPLSP